MLTQYIKYYSSYKLPNECYFRTQKPTKDINIQKNNTLKELINTFLKKNTSLQILVLGDLMIDQYLWGKMDRISPEAPVPIVDVQQRERRLGGAANAALNLQALGATCTLCGVIGEDPQGQFLHQMGAEKGLDMSLVVTQADRKTTQKTRVICSGQQVLRVDDEVRDPIPSTLAEKVWKQLSSRLHTFDGIVFSDYDKGFLNRPLIQKIIKAASQAGIPTMVDPKFRNFWAYEGCTLFKPNLKELNEGFGVVLQKNDFKGIERAIAQLQARMPHSHSLITLSEYGVLWANKTGSAQQFPAYRREIIDVSGAGDAVMAVAALGIAGGFTVSEASQLANIAGGLVCEEVGVVPIRPERLLQAITTLT